MPFGDSGINKPFDRILKAFADEAPELLLRLLGFVPAGAEADIQPLRPETAPSVVLPDYVALVRIGLAERIIFHAEFQFKYHRDVPRDMARYGGSLAWQYQIPVSSVLVLLRPDGVPRNIPGVGHYKIGTTDTTHPFKVARLWELDPTLVMDTNNPKLLPWALLMKSTDEQIRSIATIVAHQGDDEAVGRFLSLGSIRYDRSALTAMLGGGRMGLIEAIVEGSWIFQEARAKGRSQGRAEGRADEARKFLRLLLRKNFPGLESLPEIDQISDVATLESLFDQSFDASDAESIRASILAAVAKPIEVPLTPAEAES